MLAVPYSRWVTPGSRSVVLTHGTQKTLLFSSRQVPDWPSRTLSLHRSHVGPYGGHGCHRVNIATFLCDVGPLRRIPRSSRCSAGEKLLTCSEQTCDDDAVVVVIFPTAGIQSCQVAGERYLVKTSAAATLIPAVVPVCAVFSAPHICNSAHLQVTTWNPVHFLARSLANLRASKGHLA